MTSSSRFFSLLFPATRGVNRIPGQFNQLDYCCQQTATKLKRLIRIPKNQSRNFVTWCTCCDFVASTKNKTDISYVNLVLLQGKQHSEWCTDHLERDFCVGTKMINFGRVFNCQGSVLKKMNFWSRVGLLKE